MAISIYLGGTTGAQDGTLEVTGDGVGIELKEVDSVAIFHLRAPSGKQNSESVLVTAPVDCEVSRDGNTFTPTATYTAGGIQDSNTACYVKRIAITQVDARLETGLSTTPHCAQVAIENIILPDTTAPTLTGSLSATAGTLQVVLDWTDATDNVGVTGYDVEYGTSTSYSTKTTSTTSAKTITGLTNGTLYYFRVRAYDAAGNKSSWLTATATPVVVADTTAPVLTGVLSATAGAAQVVLDWPDATDNVGVTGYDVEYGTSTSYGTATTSTGSAKTITGLTNGTVYYFRVRAYDAAGNTSSWLESNATPAATDDFLGASINTTLWTPLTAANGTIAISGGLAQLNSPATTDGMLLYRKAALVLNENKTYRWKTRVNSSVVNGNYLLFSVEDTPAPFAPNSHESTTALHGLTVSANTNSVARARLMLVAQSNTGILFGRSTNVAGATLRWYDPATNAWVASGQVYPSIVVDTDYIIEFSTNTSSQWRLRMLSVDETTTLIDTGLQSWNAITSFSSSPYLIIGGEPYASVSIASASIDWYDEV